VVTSCFDLTGNLKDAMKSATVFDKPTKGKYSPSPKPTNQKEETKPTNRNRDKVPEKLQQEQISQKTCWVCHETCAQSTIECCTWWKKKLEREGKKIWTISRFVRVILAQGPC
jgi:hypothetical protein